MKKENKFIFMKCNKDLNIKIENTIFNKYNELKEILKNEFKENEKILIEYNKYFYYLYIEKINTNNYYYIYLNDYKKFNQIYNILLETFYKNDLKIKNRKIEKYY